MHLKSVAIENLRVFTNLKWDLPQDNLPGWHVIIGDNGSGKSTFLRAIALALCGPKDALALRENWETWPRGEATGKVRLNVSQHDDWDDWAGGGKRLQNYYPRCGLYFEKAKSGEVLPRAPQIQHNPERHLWSRKPGWFSASYGPFRRFTGGDPDQRKFFYSHPLLARHLSVFNENVALTEAVEWLGQLRFEQLEKNQSSGSLLDWLQRFVNQEGFLPHGVRFEEVNSKSVVFRNPEGLPMDVSRLSDGFRSILSMTFELIRQMATSYSTPNIFKRRDDGSIIVTPPGVVLVDEIDAHLHPTWQRRIGFWLTKHFPKLQFVVTTHSPLVCQAAEKGTIFRLPAPGSEQESSGFITGKDRERLIHGDVLDAFGTELFGREVDRSETAQEQLKELARLNQRAVRGLPLSGEQEKKRQTLAQAFAGHATA